MLNSEKHATRRCFMHGPPALVDILCQKRVTFVHFIKYHFLDFIKQELRAKNKSETQFP